MAPIGWLIYTACQHCINGGENPSGKVAIAEVALSAYTEKENNIQ